MAMANDNNRDPFGDPIATIMQLYDYQPSHWMHEAEPSSLLHQDAPLTGAHTASAISPTAARPSTTARLPTQPLPSEQSNDPWGAAADSMAACDAATVRQENKELEGHVVHMSEEFFELQHELNEMKESCGEKLESLNQALEAQQVTASCSERRAACAEDLVRFHEEQRRLMAGHWKSQCQMKDERIRYLNLQLTEYTIDWQQLGTQKQTEASLSHELQCLQDRHRQLRAHRTKRTADDETLAAKLEEAHAEEAELQRAETEARAAAQAAAGMVGSPTVAGSRSSRRRRPGDLPSEMQIVAARLRGQLQLLEERQHNTSNNAFSAVLPQLQDVECGGPTDTAAAASEWHHGCIWRDELDVRENQLEKITVQLDKTNDALYVAQAALAVHRRKHEDIKAKYRDAEAGLRESERQREQWRRQCLSFHRAEVDLRRAADAASGRRRSDPLPTSGNGSDVATGANIRSAIAAAAAATPNRLVFHGRDANSPVVGPLESDGVTSLLMQPPPSLPPGGAIGSALSGGLRRAATHRWRSNTVDLDPAFNC